MFFFVRSVTMCLQNEQDIKTIIVHVYCVEICVVSFDR